MRAFVFPGQGSQYIGMGQALAGAFQTAKHVFQEVDDALSQKLFALMTAGDEADLKLTENTQPALMAVSLAVLRTLEKEGGLDIATHVGFVAGHSLGEYSAYAATDSFDVPTCAKLLKTRGQAMQQAVPAGLGGMAALVGASLEQAEAIAKEASRSSEICELANDNCPGQVVISGHAGAIERAIEVAKEHGVKRAIPLPVSAPFHCSLMQPAADAMAQALADVTITVMPKVTLVPNITAQALENVDEIKPNLVQQITGRVRWTETVQFLKAQGVTEIVEVGAGKVLAGLVKRIDSEIPVLSLETPDDIEGYLQKAA